MPSKISVVATLRDPPLGFRVWDMPVPRAMVMAHTHPDVEINWLAEGSITYLIAGSRVTLRQGEFGVFWGGVPHQTLPLEGPASGIWMTLPLSWLLGCELPKTFSQRLMSGHLVASAISGERVRQWLADYSGGEATRRLVLLELEAVLARIAMADAEMSPRARSAPPRRKAKDDHHVENVLAHLAAHSAEPVSIEDLARSMRLHPKYLMSLFKRHTGMTAGSYLLGLRLAHAQRLLATTDIPIIDVAMQSGFASLSRFYAAFATTVKVRPLQFRRRHQK